MLQRAISTTGQVVDLLAPYLARIGYDGPLAPNLEVLNALQAAHIAAIPFEALDVLIDKDVELHPAAIDAKLIDARRGGYCFEQNGLFLRVLRAIGFEAEGRLARVRWMLPDDAPPTPLSHQFSRVLLDGTAWLVDVGFGATTPAAPLAMDVAGPQATAHETCRLVRTGDEWRLETAIGDGWATMYVFADVEPAPIDYEVGNWYTSTHPQSHFRQQLVAARTSADIRYALRDNRLTLRHREGLTERRFLSADEIEEALASLFLLPVDPAWRDAIERAASAEITE